MPLISALHRGDKCGQVFGKHYLRVDSLKFVCNLLGIEWCLSDRELEVSCTVVCAVATI